MSKTNLSLSPIQGDESMKRIIHFLMFTLGEKGWGLPGLLWGEPGEAKTSMIEQAFRRYGMPCQVMSPGELGEGAFGVVPVPEGVGDGMRLRMPPMAFVDQFDDVGAGGVFADELTGAPEQIKPAMLALLRERRLGGHYFGSGVRVIAAANPASIASNGRDLSIPEANRVIHIPWGIVEPEDSQKYALEGLKRFDPSDPFKELVAGKAEMASGAKLRAEEEKRVLSMWSHTYGQAIALTTSFRRAKQDWNHKRPNASSSDATGAWPSSRSWSMAAAAYAGAHIHSLTVEETMVVVAGCIGIPAASEFFKFAENSDLPDPKDVLEGKVNISNSVRLDQLFAILNSCATMTVTTKDAATKARYVDRMWEMLGDCCDRSQKEVAVPISKIIIDDKQYGGASSKKALLALKGVAAAMAG